MAEPGDQRKLEKSSNLIVKCLVSLLSTSLIQLALSMVAFIFPNSPPLALTSLSAVVLIPVAGVGQCCKRLIGVRASPPAFVFFSIIFIWGVYIILIRQVISPLMDIILHTEFILLMMGLYRILLMDPGYVTYESSLINESIESPVSEQEFNSQELLPSTRDMIFDIVAEEPSFPHQRVRCCRHCKTYVKGFDHHCSAFGNCIGQRNHLLFMALLCGFVATEATYVSCSYQFSVKTQVSDNTGLKTSLPRNLAISTMQFCILQLLWQGIFLAWHIYCICFNIKTDEWINWKKYPEFHVVVQPQPGEPHETRFKNPYNKGILWNVKEFLTERG